MSDHHPNPNGTGYFVEVAEGGPWLAQDLSITLQYLERGLWPTQEQAQAAADLSCQGIPNPSTNHQP